MKRPSVFSSFLLILMICFLPSLYAQGPQAGRANPHGDYQIKVHISGIHFLTHCDRLTPCGEMLYADATLNGKKVDLMGKDAPIIPGDYVARFVKKSHSDDLQLLGQKYEILFPDNTSWRCTVTGFSE